MNSNGFISLKLGQRVIFQHPLSQLKQITSNFIKENKKKNFKKLDVLPKFIASKGMSEMNQDLSMRLMNKKKILNKIGNTYFSKHHPNFSENLKNIENQMNSMNEFFDKRNINDYKKFEQMISIINKNKTNDKIKSMQKMNVKDYTKINTETKEDILNCISLNKKEFAQQIGLHKIDPNKINQKLEQMNQNKMNNSNKTIKTLREKAYNKTELDLDKTKQFTGSKPDLIKSNSNNNLTEYNVIQKKVVNVTNEQIELFKIFVGNSTLSNPMVVSYFDLYHPKVKFAAEKYFRSRYGSDYITLNFVYPTEPTNKQHKFRLTSEIKELFMAAQDDYLSFVNPKLFMENGKEITNNRKIKCIGALNLNNNSIIKIFKQ